MLFARNELNVCLDIGLSRLRTDYSSLAATVCRCAVHNSVKYRACDGCD